MKSKYRVQFDEQQHRFLSELAHKGRNLPPRTLLRARILLKSHEGWSARRIAEALDTSESTVERLRKRVAQVGLDGSLYDRSPSRPRRARKLDGHGEAKLIELACSKAPDGRVRWTMVLLAQRLVELHVVESISREAVRMTLKKTF